MTDSPLRKALLQRQLTVGTWIQIGDPTVAEILGNTGFDWLAVDCEHTEIGPAEFVAVARGTHGRGPAILARVRENDTLAIRQILDLGATGIIVPLVNSAAEAERAVRAAKYPPRGIRGYAFSRMNEWGADFDDYARVANENIAVVVMIESRQGAENIDEILAVDGVDGVFIGPYDMSGSFGVPGQTDAPPVLEAREKVLAACDRAGKSAGIHVVIPTPEAIRAAMADGFTFLAVGVDTVFIDRGAREALAAIRS